MADTYERRILRWRQARDRRLRQPDGWLSLAGLAWLREGSNRVGSDPANEVALPKGPLLVGRIEVAGGAATFVAEPGSGVLHVEEGVVGTLPLEDDREDEPTVLTVDSLKLHLIRREGALAVRIRDPDSPVLRSFRGMEYFNVDRRWRLKARFEPADPGRRVVAPNVMGTAETYRSPGTVVFEIEDRPYQLEAFQEPRETDLFIVFGDATNGAETYPGGRYLYAKPRRADGTLTVDFNKAYNPPCVFTAYATCVLPLPENRLPFRVEAGEKTYRPERRQAGLGASS
jgi:uncharacterized protein (DUF1684 family)